MSKLGIYARQSIEKETTGSIDDQIKEGKLQAEKLGLPFEIYIDRGLTAANDTLDNRPDFLRLVADIQSGKISSVFVIDQSRLSRNQTTQLYIKKIFAENQVKVFTKLDGIIDFQDTDSEFFADLRTLFASKYVKDTSKKIRGVLLNNALAGKAGGGATMPYGFRKNKAKMLVHDPEEIAVYKRIVEMSLAGMGSGKIAEILNNEGTKTKGAKSYRNGITIKNKYTGSETKISSEQLDWAPNTIITILKNSIYCGKRKYRGEIIPIEPVISEELWQKVQDNLTANKSYSGGKKVHFYLLKGLLRCEKCGRNLYGYVKESEGKQQRVYMCSSKREVFCGMKSINITRLEKLVWKTVRGSDLIFKRVIEEFNSSADSKKLAEIEKSLVKLNQKKIQLDKKLDAIIELYSNARIDLAKFDVKQAELKQEETLLKEQVQKLDNEKAFYSKYAELKDTGTKAEQVLSTLTNLSQEKKREVINLMVKDIRIDYDPANFKHLIKIILNPNSEIIQNEIVLTPTEKKQRELEFDLLYDVDDESNKFMLIDDKYFYEMKEENGQLKAIKSGEAQEWPSKKKPTARDIATSLIV